MNHTCNFPCYDFRPHADPKYVVCTKCNEIYLKSDLNVSMEVNEGYGEFEVSKPMDMSINEEYEYEQPGGFDHMST